VGTITIEVDEHAALARHVEDLQAVITKRNKTIEDLTNRLEAGEGSEFVATAFENGQRKGWQACASYIMDATKTAGHALDNTYRTALDAYLRPQIVID
jgi:predicted transcriptional regulator of viral defense system